MELECCTCCGREQNSGNATEINRNSSVISFLLVSNYLLITKITRMHFWIISIGANRIVLCRRKLALLHNQCTIINIAYILSCACCILGKCSSRESSNQNPKVHLIFYKFLCFSILISILILMSSPLSNCSSFLLKIPERYYVSYIGSCLRLSYIWCLGAKTPLVRYLTK